MDHASYLNQLFISRRGGRGGPAPRVVQKRSSHGLSPYQKPSAKPSPLASASPVFMPFLNAAVAQIAKQLNLPLPQISTCQALSEELATAAVLQGFAIEYQGNDIDQIIADLARTIITEMFTQWVINNYDGQCHIKATTQNRILDSSPAGNILYLLAQQQGYTRLAASPSAAPSPAPPIISTPLPAPPQFPILPSSSSPIIPTPSSPTPQTSPFF